jgi:hypothetical protein
MSSRARSIRRFVSMKAAALVKTNSVEAPVRALQATRREPGKVILSSRRARGLGVAISTYPAATHSRRPAHRLRGLGSATT